jgi:hypothetical protein
LRLLWIRETDAGARLTADHYHPRVRGGTDDPENLVYACHACNGYKGDHWQPDSEERILHPLRDNLGEHYREAEDYRLLPLTVTGTFHITRLRLNRAELVFQRARRQQARRNHQEQEELLTVLRRLELEVATLISRIQQWEVDED